jgi:hypothetical protein
MICPECGNILVVQSSSPVCLVCQHTGRGAVAFAGVDVTVPGTDKTAKQLIDAANAEWQARGLAAALDATYAALAYERNENRIAQEAKQQADAQTTFECAQEMIRLRMRNQEHFRKRPNWEEIDAEDRERQEVCQTCLGTRRYLTLPCPDCSEDGDRERD